MRKFAGMFLAMATAFALTASPFSAASIELSDIDTETEEEVVAEASEVGENYHIGIVTGSVSQSEDGRRGAEAFQEKYGEERVTLAIYPDNFSEELETTVQTIVNLSDDPEMKAIVVNEAVPGTTEAFRQIKERRPDILCVAASAHEDLPEIGSAADLVCNTDFVSRGYLMVRTAHELGCDTFVHISFPRHLSYEVISRRMAIMEKACEEFGMTFVSESAPDPTTDVGVPGAQAFILEHVPEWLEKYGTNACFFSTNDAHIEPLLKRLLENGGYFIESDIPSPLVGYPGALGLEFSEEGGDFEKIIAKVEAAVVEKGGAGHFGTWVYSEAFMDSAGLAQHAMNVLEGTSELYNIDDIAAAYKSFAPSAAFNGSNYTNANTGVKLDNVFLIYQDTYIMGDPGYYMGSTDVEVTEEYFTVK